MFLLSIVILLVILLVLILGIENPIPVWAALRKHSDQPRKWR